MEKTLYEISNEILEVFVRDFEDYEEFENALNLVEMEFKDKADNIAKLRQEMRRQSESIQSEIERLQSKKRAVENNEVRLMRYLEDEMERSNMIKFKTDLFSFNIQNNPPSLSISSDADIPEDYISYEKKIDKRGLLRDIKQSGLYVKGVELTQSRGLRIR